jgi:integrase
VRGIYVQRSPAERMTVDAAVRRYLAEVTITKKQSTQSGEQLKVKPLLGYFGKYSLAAVTPDIVATYRDQRLAAGLKNNTVRLELALLSHLFNVAMREWGLGLVYNPVASIRKPRPGEGRNRRLTRDEEKLIIETATRHSNPMFGWIVRLALATSMRSGEIVSLTRSQVDLNRRVVRLYDTKNDSSRTVPLSLEATEVLREALAHPIRPIDTELVFFGEPGRHGKRRPYDFNKQWTLLKKELGLKDLHFHDLRHEAVSRFVEVGLSDQEVAAISGHKSMQMLKRYTHLRAEDLVSKLDALTKHIKG